MPRFSPGSKPPKRLHVFLQTVYGLLPDVKENEGNSNNSGNILVVRGRLLFASDSSIRAPW
jgi:hypothetical protein